MDKQMQQVLAGALTLWTIFIGSMMFSLGYKWSSPDCSACEEGLKEQTTYYRQCEADLMECSQQRCDDVAELERERCQDYLETYSKLRCKVCEKINGSVPPIVYPPAQLTP